MKVRSNKLSDNIQYYVAKLSTKYSVTESRTLVYTLIESFFGFSKIDLVKDNSIRISESEMLKLHFAVKDLLKNKPIQYITGEVFFGNLKLKTNENVLIPRPETEELVNLIISDIQRSNFRILDIGTGTGCIPLALKKRSDVLDVTGVDISDEAIVVAKQNAADNELNVCFKQADVFSDKQMKDLGRFDVIVSNPPYIKFSERKLMQENVLGFEPELALFVSDDDPLIFYRRIAELGRSMLNEKGLIYFEINESHGEDMLEMMSDLGYRQIYLKQDFNGKDRFVCGLK